ncbi:MAG: TonB-dependent receptor [Gammaproteobacteria bacterium]|nr:TonB-dependent receptor [Gammaproteobacteria bacterium]
MIKQPRLALATLAAAIVASSTPQAQGSTEPASEIALPVIVVTADPIGGRTTDELIQPISVVAGAELDRRREATLGALLDGLPGVANADFGPGVGRPTIRGQQGSRVKVLEDGLGTADVSGEGADHAIAIDPARADQIEVFRGSSTLAYGSGAAGGVVNVRTRRFNPEFAQVPGVRGEVSYGANGKDRQGYVALDLPVTDDVVIRADASRRRSNDFDIDGFQQSGQTEGRRGKLVNSSISTDAYSLTGLLRRDWGFVGAGVSRWETDYGIPENFDARPRELGGQSDEFERVFADYNRFDLRGELRQPFAGIEAVRFKLAYTEFEQDEVEFQFARTPEGGELEEAVVEAVFENDELDLRIELVPEPIAQWRSVLGFQYSQRDFEADDPRGGDRTFYVRPTTTRTAALFVVGERPVDFGRIEVGARIERERASADDVIGSRVDGVTLPEGDFLALPEDPGNRTFTPFSLSAGAIVELGAAHHLRAAITRAERAPSPEQLYAFGRHSAAGTFEVGDVTLGNERYVNFELGVDRHAGPLRYEVSIFYNRVDDFIFLQSEDDGTGSPVAVNDIGNRAGEGAAASCAPGEGGLCRLRNQFVFNKQADAEFWGGEIAAVADIVNGATPVSLRFSADSVRGNLRRGGNLPRITPVRVGIGIDARFGELDISADYRRVFKQNRTGDAEDRTSGYNMLSLDLTWNPAAFAAAELFLRARNLLDEDGRQHQSFFKDESPIIGRAFIGGVRFHLGG